LSKLQPRLSAAARQARDSAIAVRENIVCRLPRDSRRAYLTFDDGPDSDFTPRVLDLLAGAGIKATFFVVGVAAASQAGLIRRMVGEGHEVANHTWSHPHPWRVRCNVAREEVYSASHALADILGRWPRYFRPPFGRLRRCMTEAAEELGQSLVLWSLSGKDWGPLGRAASIDARLANAKAGDIILLHDARWRYNRPWEMLKVLPAFLARFDHASWELGLLEPNSIAPLDRSADTATPDIP
jgi:peptidoglycan/xylan/chitin deacetylase (PgdA/CDA1 family)